MNGNVVIRNPCYSVTAVTRAEFEQNRQQDSIWMTFHNVLKHTYVAGLTVHIDTTFETCFIN